MKYQLLFIIFICTFGSISIQAQIPNCCPTLKIEEVLPTNPTVVYSIQISYKAGTPNDSYLTQESFFKNGNILSIKLCYKNGLHNTPAQYSDSVNVGVLPQGKYHIVLEAFLSTDSACLNRIDSNTVVDSFTVSSAVSIEEKQWVEQLKVFPNPAKDLLNIHALDKNLTIQELKLKDLQGKEVKFDLIHIEPSIKRINLTGLPSGIYFLEIRSNKGSTVTQIEVFK